jgi:hypothetical protein
MKESVKAEKRQYNGGSGNARHRKYGGSERKRKEEENK